MTPSSSQSDDPRAPPQKGEPRPFTLALIIGYKFVKAPLVLLLAVLLTASPRGAEHVARALAHELSEGSALLAKLGAWLGMHVSRSDVRHAAFFAWGDGLMTLLEGVLLLRGHAWGEWIVVVGLAALIPFEAVSFERHPGPLKIVVLLLNVAIVIYLAARRWQQRGRHRHSGGG
ncbi:MAG TPA: DUF2127 domain-containing protein [Polyangiaceae bacterium]|nr:DUF2127 domain-containing protein [Polyangiaceae bacterium]